MNEKKAVVKVQASQIVTDPEAQPITYSQIAQELGLSGPLVSARELIGHTLTIVRAKPFESTYEAQGHAWFCVVHVDGSDDFNTVVLGGGAIKEILDAYSMTSDMRPLQFVLTWVEGGKYGGYYSLE